MKCCPRRSASDHEQGLEPGTGWEEGQERPEADVELRVIGQRIEKLAENQPRHQIEEVLHNPDEGIRHEEPGGKAHEPPDGLPDVHTNTSANPIRRS